MWRHVTTWKKGHMTWWGESLWLSHHFGNFFDNWFCGRQDKTLLIIGGVQNRTFLNFHVTSCDRVIKSHMTLNVGASHSNWPMCQIWGFERFHLLSCDIMWKYYQKYMWLGKWESLSLSHYSVKIDVRSRDIRFLICHVTSREYIIMVTCDLECGNP